MRATNLVSFRTHRGKRAWIWIELPSIFVALASMEPALHSERGELAAICRSLPRIRRAVRSHGGKLASNRTKFRSARGIIGSDRGKLALTAPNVDAKPCAVKTYSMDELTELTKFSARTVRQYIAFHMIPKPKLAGSATRYSRETLGKLLAIRHWRLEQKITTTGMRRALRAADEDEWEAWAEDVDPIAPPPPPPAPVVAAKTAAPAQVAALSKAPATDAAPLDGALGEKWHHVPLMPGLVLLMRDGAGEMTASVAREIQKRYRAG